MIKPKKYTHRSASERSELVERWRSSGQSVTRFCREHGISSSSLQRWRQAQESRVSFVELEPERTPEAVEVDRPWELEISLPNGVALRIRG